MINLITFFCTLQIHVKEDCELPIGLHPMFRIPKKMSKIKINPEILNLDLIIQV